MDITGSQKVKAPRPQVFSALLNPTILKESIPGCESVEIVDIAGNQQVKLTIGTGIPGFKGPYFVFLQTGEVVPPSRVVLIAEPSSSIGTIKATCNVDLADEAGDTNLSYNAHAEMDGKVSAIPDIILKGAVKGGLEQFFKNFEKQVNAITA